MVNTGNMTEIFESYAKASSAHGLSRLARSTSHCGRAFWALVCLTALGLLFGQGTLLVSRYYSYPASVQIEIGNNPVPFPAVSICNLRPLDVYTLGDVAFNGSGGWRWNIGEDWEYSGRSNSSVPLFERSIIQFGNYYRAYREYAAQVAQTKGDLSILWDADRKLLSRMVVAANLENPTAAFQGGVQQEEFIAFCEYHGYRCSYSDFTWFLDPGYFNCYTYDLTHRARDHRAVIEGPGQGLTLVLFVPTISIMKYQGEVNSWLAINQEISLGGEGVRVIIHRPNTVPFPLQDGLDVPRGGSTSLGVSLTQYLRLGLPHGNCTHKISMEGFQNYTYTQATCQHTCLQQLVLDTCRCTDANLPLPPGDHNVPMCATFDLLPTECIPPALHDNMEGCAPLFHRWFERMACMRETRGDVARSLDAWAACQCAPHCDETEYSIMYSMSDWPMEEQSEDLVRNLLHVEGFIDRFHPDKARAYFGDVDARAQTPTIETYREFIRDKNFLRLSVYISDSSVLRIVETEAYTLTQLASDVGGLLSLWIGVSIITLVEMAEFILSVFQEWCKPCRETQKETKARNASLHATMDTAHTIQTNEHTKF